MRTGWRLRPVGDRAALVDVDSNERARALAARVVGEYADKLIDVVPGHRTVLLRWETPHAPALDLHTLFALAGAVPAPTGPTVTLDVVYDGRDLDEVARHVRLSVAELIARHTKPTYRVGFMGFAPGFAYLIGGDPGLRPPRRADPRARVPAGAVAVAGPFTACYPAALPGGWRLLGRTDVALFDPGREQPALLRPGTGVRFCAA